MTYENIQLPVPHFAGDRNNANVYYFYNDALRAKQLSSPYSDVGTYPLDSYIGDVVSCQFDGVYYWSLYPKPSGFVVQKWEIENGLGRLRDEFAFSSSPAVTYDATALAVDSYSTELTSAAVPGAAYLDVNDSSDFQVGDTIIIGPSTYSSYVYLYETATVTSISGNTLYLSSSLVRGFSSGDSVYTTRYFYVFNKYSPYDMNKGSILRFEYDTGTLSSYSSSSLFYGVTGACFYEGSLVFVRGNEVVVCNPDTLNVIKHFALDNVDTDRSSILTTYDLWIYSDTVYSLRNKYVYENAGEWVSEDWGDYYNYVTSVYHTLTTSEIYFVELTADNMLMHAQTAGVPAPTSNITVTVLDQARQPLDGRSVTMTSSIGSVSPSTGTTVSGGKFYCQYTGTSADSDVIITASVT